MAPLNLGEPAYANYSSLSLRRSPSRGDDAISAIESSHADASSLWVGEPQTSHPPYLPAEEQTLALWTSGQRAISTATLRRLRPPTDATTRTTRATRATGTTVRAFRRVIPSHRVIFSDLSEMLPPAALRGPPFRHEAMLIARHGRRSGVWALWGIGSANIRYMSIALAVIGTQAEARELQVTGSS